MIISVACTTRKYERFIEEISYMVGYLKVIKQTPSTQYCSPLCNRNG